MCPQMLVACRFAVMTNSSLSMQANSSESTYICRSWLPPPKLFTSYSQRFMSGPSNRLVFLCGFIIGFVLHGRISCSFHGHITLAGALLPPGC